MLTYRFDTQLLIEGHDLDEAIISDYITKHIEGDCLLAVGDDELIKIHFHTNTPWKVLEYAASLGDIFDVVVENMERQAAGQKVKRKIPMRSLRRSFRLHRDNLYMQY